MCGMSDEAGGYLSMKGDGHICGRLFITEKGKVNEKKISKRDRRFIHVSQVFTQEHGSTKHR